uniref:Uncharacterized protein n=1 Tax=Anguilla anguilla TaxID=7936 RepID=A0A0E9VLN3_ANGAN
MCLCRLDPLKNIIRRNSPVLLRVFF